MECFSRKRAKQATAKTRENLLHFVVCLFFMLRSFPHPLSHSLKAERASLTQDFVTLHAIANSTGIFVECFISKRYITTM